jgi:hypothetical protein
MPLPLYKLSAASAVIRFSPWLLDSIGRRPSALPRHALLCLRALAVAFAVAVLLFDPAPAHAQLPQGWTLQDEAGRSWSLTLFEQADPVFPGGLRLRFTARSGSKPPRLRDGLGAAWELASRSDSWLPRHVGSPAGFGLGISRGDQRGERGVRSLGRLSTNTVIAVSTITRAVTPRMAAV